MGLLEWIGESANPGPIRSVNFGGRHRDHRPRWSILVCFLIALGLVGLTVWILYAGLQLRTWTHWSIAAGIGLTYLCLAYFIHPQPDASNIGWAGGLFDHPFRYSDDVNRHLLFFLIFLFPGRFISESLIDSVLLLSPAPAAKKKSKRKRWVAEWELGERETY